MEDAIVCKDIMKTYGEGSNSVQALRGVSLTVPSGTLQLLMGPSGSGKTTLISIMAGILTADSGSCSVLGTNLKEVSDKEKTQFRGKNIGFLFQAFNLIPSLTIEDNIIIPLLLNGVARKEAIERAKALLAEFGLGDKVGKMPSELSGGQEQRVAIARALAHTPQLIVCDEPTSFLDHHTGMKIMELLQNMVKTSKVTLIVVTHDPRITQFADNIKYLDDGLIVEKS
ncbi:MAG: ABC transporter ATP-binding protein [Verrucomicrobia bacterium]|nr:ABC transporter ATP-binding protein [Verrucomicrobiota bacterium]